MALVTFSVRDYGYDAFSEFEKLVVLFVPSGAGFTSVSAFPEKTVYVNPDADGLVEADLVPTLGLAPEVWYTVKFEWFDRHPVQDRWVRRGWSEVLGKLRVPTEGGALGDLLGAVPPPGAYVWGFGPPPSFINAIYVDLLGMVGGLYIPTGTVGTS